MSIDVGMTLTYDGYSGLTSCTFLSRSNMIPSQENGKERPLIEGSVVCKCPPRPLMPLCTTSRCQALTKPSPCPLRLRRPAEHDRHSDHPVKTRPHTPQPRRPAPGDVAQPPLSLHHAHPRQQQEPRSPAHFPLLMKEQVQNEAADRCWACDSFPTQVCHVISRRDPQVSDTASPARSCLVN